MVIHLSSKSSFEIAVTQDDQVVNEGRNVSLFCLVRTKLKDGNDKWKTCTWRRNSDGANCSYEHKKGNDSKNELEAVGPCSALIKHYQFLKEEYTNVRGQQCIIVIPSVSQLDNADWTCTIMQCKNENVGGCGAKDGNNVTVHDTINVKVMLP